jgi:hypothetical protein
MAVTLQQLLGEVLLIEFSTAPQNSQTYYQTYGIRTTDDLYFNRVIVALPQEFRDSLFKELANKKLEIQSKEIDTMQQQIAAKQALNAEISNILPK